MSAKAAVICLCYNQEKYVATALRSVLDQNYAVELIVVDDASTDNSVTEIKKFIKDHPEFSIRTLFHKDNVGNCRAFNRALELTDADYVIDLAADDVLLPDRVEEGVKSLESNPKAGINFTNASYITASGEFIRNQYNVDEEGRSIEEVPSGDLFAQILKRYFICSPTMMYRTSILKKIGGYDKELAYEDFDIMLRISRNHPFSYTDKILVKKRVLHKSMVSKQYKKGNRQLHSTLKICRKAFEMLRSKKDKWALLKRLSYESKQAFINKRFLLLAAFINLGVKTILQK